MENLKRGGQTVTSFFVKKLGLYLLIPKKIATFAPL